MGGSVPLALSCRFCSLPVFCALVPGVSGPFPSLSPVSAPCARCEWVCPRGLAHRRPGVRALRGMAEGTRGRRGLPSWRGPDAHRVGKT